MNIDLTVIEKKEEDSSTTITATAVVTPDPPPPTPKGQARRVTPLTVKFTINGAPKGVSPVDANGHASIELKKLEAGKTYTITAEVLGASVPTSATEAITIAAPPTKTKVPTGPFGWAMMVLFWVIVWVVGPGWLTMLYLGITIGILFLIAKLRGTTLGSVVGNNNWVFFSVLAMAAISAVIGHFNPLPAQGAVSWLKSLFTNAPSGIHGHIFWRFFNNVFFGKTFTGGWSHAALLYLVSVIPAFFISFSDEIGDLWKNFKGKHQGKATSFLTLIPEFGRFLLKDGVAEIFWAFLKRK
ncbi:hypothetical protein IT399_01500 [Candidatus Nomurabacteria bacterium]|nr:hypothetical protein [Candidatus Nomurabacteria bacterium]